MADLDAASPGRVAVSLRCSGGGRVDVASGSSERVFARGSTPCDGQVRSVVAPTLVPRGGYVVDLQSSGRLQVYTVQVGSDTGA